MTSVQKAVFPGIVSGVVFLIFFTGFLLGPRTVNASNQTQIKESTTSGQGGAAINQPAAEQQEALAASSAPEPAADGCAVQNTFPESIRRWCNLIQSYALQAGLNPNLVASVILQESGGNENAISKSGAVGLMQVMPRDGVSSKFQCVNGPCFSNRPTMQELYDPEFNIAYGTQMLANLIQHTGSTREALKSYGPMDMGYAYADIILGIYSRYAGE